MMAGKRRMGKAQRAHLNPPRTPKDGHGKPLPILRCIGLELNADLDKVLV